MQLQDHLQAWQEYLDFDDSDFLLQVAVAHAQFELLHPFKDGNGRIGRLLIPLFMFQKKALSQPMFYLSEYLEANRDEYYQRLSNISKEGDWNGWIAFFLKAITVQAKQNSARVKAIMALYDDMKQRIHEITRSQYSVYLLDALFSKPIFKTSDLASQLERDFGISKRTVPALLRQLKEADVLLELTPGSGRKPAVLCFAELLNLAEGKEVF